MILINFYLNNKNISKSVSSTLSSRELLENVFYSSARLNQKSNNNFDLILLDLKPVYSEMIPAFMLNGHSVHTVDGIEDTKVYQNILSILKEEDLGFCKDCFATRILLFFYFIKNKVEKKSDILSYYNTVKCNCIDINSFLNIYSRIEELEKNNDE